MSKSNLEVKEDPTLRKRADFIEMRQNRQREFIPTR